MIELLIVIAIIGILASLVLATVGTSRSKADDARLKSSIRQLRVLTEQFYDGNSYVYTGLDTCIDTPTEANCGAQTIADEIIILKNEIEDAADQTGIVAVAADAQEFCIAAPLKVGNSSYICVNSVGSIVDGSSTSTPCDTTPECTFSWP